MIPFVREIEFEYGRCDQVSPLIRRVIADNPGPFTYVGTGTYIVGRGTVAVIDPGPDLDGHLQALLAALEGETVSHIWSPTTTATTLPLPARCRRRPGRRSSAAGRRISRNWRLGRLSRPARTRVSARMSRSPTATSSKVQAGPCAP
jgi:hypothetical protein